MSDYSFSSEHRILKKNEFETLKIEGRLFKRESVVLFFKKNRSHGLKSRIGISVPKKCGPSVTRNVIKRTIREWFRKSDHKNTGVDFFVIVRPHSKVFLNSKNVDLKRLGENISDIFFKTRNVVANL